MRVTIFDSGVGGLPILAKLRQLFPQIDFIYLSDRRHLPYGDKTDTAILGFVMAQVMRFESDVLILACNTATAVASSTLRARLEVPVFGIEPATKPALEQANGQVTVLCTPVTLRWRQWNNPRLDIRATAELASEIESRLFSGKSLDSLATEVSSQCSRDIVLGCTHYTFLAEKLRKLGHTVYDGADGLIQHSAKALRNLGGGTIMFADAEIKELYTRIYFDKNL